MILDTRLTGAPGLPGHEQASRKDHTAGHQAMVGEHLLDHVGLAGDIVDHGCQTTAAQDGADRDIADKSKA